MTTPQEYDRLKAECNEVVSRLSEQLDAAYGRIRELKAREEHLLHVIYDAWQQIELEAEVAEDERYGGVSRAILSGQLEDYPPFIKAVSR